MGRPLGSKSKQKILEAVERLIAQKGINHISLRDIANETHLSPGTLFYHYASKDDLVFDIISRHIDELKTEYIAWLERHQSDLTPERFLEIIFYKAVKLFNRARLHVFITNQCMSENENLRKRYLEKYQEWRGEFKRGLMNVFPNCPDPDTFAGLLLTIIDGLIVHDVLEIPSTNRERMIALVKRIGTNK